MAKADGQGRVVLVTGGMGGLGETISTKMADAGYRVVVTYSPGNTKSSEWISSMKGNGYDIVAVACDVADIDSCTRAVDEVQSKVGAVDVLVNNAGITRDMTFKKMDKVNWDAVMRTNLDSLFNMTKQVADGMVERGWGRVVNISSVNGSKGAFGQTNYSAAKAGVHGLHQGARTRSRGRRRRHRQHDLARLHRHEDGDRHSRRRAEHQDPAADSRSAGSASPKRWPGSSSISLPTRRPFSPEPISRSTAGSTCNDGKEQAMMKSGIDQEALITMFAEAGAKQGEALRESVRTATLKALQGRELTLDNVRKVVKSVASATSIGAARNPGRPGRRRGRCSRSRSPAWMRRCCKPSKPIARR